MPPAIVSLVLLASSIGIVGPGTVVSLCEVGGPVLIRLSLPLVKEGASTGDIQVEVASMAVDRRFARVALDGEGLLDNLIASCV